MLVAAAALLLIYVREPRPDLWIGFMVAARRPALAIGALTLLTAFWRAGRIASASRRLLELQRSGNPAVSPHSTRARPKNIVICCDGTGNRSRTARDFTRIESNVAKFFDRVLPAEQCEWRQSKWYDAGVGTGTSTTSRRVALLGKAANWVGAKAPSGVLGVVEKFRTIKELAFGIGITENVTEGYREIVRQYEPGDRIFLVGFSRGAYTARCIADVIDDIGLLRAEHVRFAADVVQLYRYRPGAEHKVVLNGALRHDNVTIAFLGLWDTVASLGVPLWGWSYSIWRLWSNLGMAPSDINCCRVVRHALSIDEERSQFFPTLFKEAAGSDGNGPDIEQRWFRGAHAGVGGGYEDTSLSDIALTWLMKEAERCQLEFEPDWDQALKPNALGMIMTQLERQRAWRVSGTWPRWHPCGTTSSGFGYLDPSVLERARHASGIRDKAAATSSDELLTLQPGERARIRIRGDYTWHRTGLVFETGARYRITYSEGTWRDGQAPSCGPAGQAATGADVRRLLGFGKRVIDGQWMELIGHVAHPRVWQQKELGAWKLLKHLLWEDPEELTRTLIPLGRHLTDRGHSIDVDVHAASGVFYGFANDWWLAYDNNSGAVMLEVQRLADEEAPAAVHYVVQDTGTVMPVSAHSR
jgi:uncharacterized protein (DUF2235 family)